MNDENVVRCDNYWRTITRNEEFIRQNGHHGCPDWEDKWHQDLEDAYLQVRPLLTSVTQRRMFHSLPGGLNPFEAENYHHALVLVLNPPELWFGNMGMLRSPEYLSLKRGAQESEHVISNLPGGKGTVTDSQVCLEELNDTALNILEAMDKNVRRTLAEITTLSGYSPRTVYGYSTRLQEAGLIEKSGRGFIRLISLPNGGASQ